MQNDDEGFCLGSMTIDSVLVSQVRRFQINFGINVVAERGDGDIWPSVASIETITPTITLREIDTEWWNVFRRQNEEERRTAVCGGDEGSSRR